MSETGRKLGRILLPLLLHLGISYAVVFISGFVCEVTGKGAAKDLDAALMTAISAAVTLPVLGWLWKNDRSRHLSAVERKKRSVWFYGMAFLCGALASCMGSFLMKNIGITEQFSNQVQEELFASGMIVQVLGLGVIVPVMEELLYRGLFYQRLRETLPRRYAVCTAALIFALSHGNMIQIIYAFPMALLLHWFYEACGSLAAPVLFHMGANLISIWVEAAMH